NPRRPPPGVFLTGHSDAGAGSNNPNRLCCLAGTWRATGMTSSRAAATLVRSSRLLFGGGRNHLSKSVLSLQQGSENARRSPNLGRFFVARGHALSHSFRCDSGGSPCRCVREWDRTAAEIPRRETGTGRQTGTKGDLPGCGAPGGDG